MASGGSWASSGCRRPDVLRSTFCLAALLAGLCASAPPATAQSLSSTNRCERGDAPSFKGIFASTLTDFRRLPTRETAGLLAVGGAAAFAVHPADDKVSDHLSGLRSLHETFEPGAVLGGLPLQLGAALATYGVGRAFGKPCAALIGADLAQAQLVAQTLTYAIKSTVRRQRPEGAGFAFPSGHTSVAFASATVLQRHYGWKVGLPAYAAATYVATSRVQMKRHYLSDVAFGAALGIAAGRTVTIPGGRKMTFGAIGTELGTAAGFTWVGRK